MAVWSERHTGGHAAPAARPGGAVRRGPAAALRTTDRGPEARPVRLRQRRRAGAGELPLATGARVPRAADIRRRHPQRSSAATAIPQSLVVRDEPASLHAPAAVRGVPGGERLRPEASRPSRTVHGALRISDITVLSVAGAGRGAFFEPRWPEHASTPVFSERELTIGQILKEIGSRLRFLRNVGLEYLTRSHARPATLSGGEGQRIRLATQIGSGLIGVLYVLRRAVSIGLHQRDNARLLGRCKGLRDLGNTVLWSWSTTRRPSTPRTTSWTSARARASTAGGSWPRAPRTRSRRAAQIAHRPVPQRQAQIPMPLATAQAGNGRRLRVKNATGEQPEAASTWTIPARQVFVCVTGVSGSGKSTLVYDILYKALAQRLYRTPRAPRRERGARRPRAPGQGHRHRPVAHRADAALQSGDLHRRSSRPSGRCSPPCRRRRRARLHAGPRFSFNVKGGRCEACQGDGYAADTRCSSCRTST